MVNDSPISENFGLRVAVNASYQSKASSVLNNELGFEIDDFTLVGGQFALHTLDDRWEVQAFVNNAFDVYHWKSTQKGNETLVRYAGMPRTFGVRLIFKN